MKTTAVKTAAAAKGVETKYAYVQWKRECMVAHPGVSCAALLCAACRALHSALCTSSKREYTSPCSHVHTPTHTPPPPISSYIRYPNHVASWKELYLMQRKAIAASAASSMEKHDSHHSEVVNSKALAEAHAALPAGAPRFQKKGKKFVRRVPLGAARARVHGLPSP